MMVLPVYLCYVQFGIKYGLEKAMEFLYKHNDVIKTKYRSGGETVVWFDGGNCILMLFCIVLLVIIWKVIRNLPPHKMNM